MSSFVFNFRYAGRLVNEAIEDIMALARDDKLTENDYPFLVNLLNKDLSRSDIVVLTHSMLVDGLTTVSIPLAVHFTERG